VPKLTSDFASLRERMSTVASIAAVRADNLVLVYEMAEASR